MTNLVSFLMTGYQRESELYPFLIGQFKYTRTVDFDRYWPVLPVATIQK